METTAHLMFSPATPLKGYSTSTRKEWLTPEAIRVRYCCGIRVLEFDRLLNLLSLEFCIDRWSSEMHPHTDLCVLATTTTRVQTECRSTE